MSRKSRERHAAHLARSQEQTVANVIHEERLTIEAHSGPLPSPDVLARFNDIVPGGAERIFAVFEQQAQHRMHLEKTVIVGDANRASYGLILGFLIALAFLGGSVWLGLSGQPILGGVLGTVDLVALVTVFVYADRRRQGERSAKRRQLNLPD